MTGRSFTIHWHLFVRATSRRSAETVLRRIAKAIGREVTPESCERYWKIPSLFDVWATTALDTPDIARATFETLQLCGNLAYHWHVGSPQGSGERGWSFEGMTSTTVSTIRLVGLDTAFFEVRNFTLEVVSPEQLGGE